MAVLTPTDGSRTSTGVLTSVLPAGGGPTWVQREVELPGRQPGFYVITDEVVGALPELESFSCGMAHIFIKHTSASLTINENVAQEVLDDFQSWFDRAVAEDCSYWTHTEEGPDDMPAHIKSALVGPSVTLPISEGRLLLGQYQGIYLCEHRSGHRTRTLVATVCGSLNRSPDLPAPAIA